MTPPLELAPARVEVVHRPDGTTLVRSPVPLERHARCVTDWLERWARERPEATFLAEHGAGGELLRWSYREARVAVLATAGALLELGASEERPLVLLGENSIDHAILSLAAQHVGVPAVPLSPAYSRSTSDHGRLRRILALVRPRVLHLDEAAPSSRALEDVDLEDVQLVLSRGGVPPGALLAPQLRRTRPGREVAQANARVGPDTVAKVLFTSGSTGEPKGVLNTQRMLTSNQRALAQCWPFVAARPPILVDWLPWSHTFGSNQNFFLALRNGGALHISAGKPIPELVHHSLEDLRAIAPTLYFDVPRGYGCLLPHLERDEALRDHFFSRLELLFFAGAALPEDIFGRLRAVSALSRGGVPVPMASGWGSTETAPMATCVHFPIPSAGAIGLPAPGCELKLVPSGEKLEMRVRGPNVTPGYLGRPDLDERAFDEEGFYRTGDAGRFVEAGRPERGLVFDGRLGESFKLTTGTWVHAGALREASIEACAPLVSDAVVAGHGRDEVGLLIFRDEAAWAEDPDPRGRVERGLRALAAAAGGSSRRVARALVLDEPPSIDEGEITDKGYLNQRRILERRAALVEALYDDADPRVVRIV